MTPGSRRQGRGAACAGLAVMLLVAGCGPKPAVEPPAPPEPDPCAVGPEGPLPGRGGSAPIRVALDEAVDWSRAPVPSTGAERLVFRQCFETLVRVDCTGRVRPGLAESWEASDGGRVWRFTLRPGARFWDGEQADAFAVARALVRLHGPETSLPAELRWIDAGAVRPVGARRLEIAFSSGHRGNRDVRYFAHPATAVMKFAGDRPWPVGTGRFRIDPGAEAGGIRLLPHRESTWSRSGADAGPAGDEGPALEIRPVPGADPRDLLAGGADVVIARSQVFTDYAGQLPEFRVIPLPWDRIYVLLAPLASAGADAAPRIGDADLADLRRDLALQGSASDARSASGLVFDVTLSGDCRLDPPPPAAGPPPPSDVRIVYPEGDADAELLAERAAALAIMGAPALREAMPGSYLARPGISPRTQALSRSSWERAVAGQAEYGYLYPLRREVLDHCGLLTTLRDRVPWVHVGAGDRGPNLLPLVVTRPVAAVRRGLGGLRVDGDGTLLLDRAGWLYAGMTP